MFFFPFLSLPFRTVGKGRERHDVVFLAPKKYAGINTTKNIEITKIKGYKRDVRFQQLKELLIAGKSLQMDQYKRYKNTLDRKIKIKNEVYSLTVKYSIRKLVFFYKQDGVQPKGSRF